MHRPAHRATVVRRPAARGACAIGGTTTGGTGTIDVQVRTDVTD